MNIRTMMLALALILSPSAMLQARQVQEAPQAAGRDFSPSMQDRLMADGSMILLASPVMDASATHAGAFQPAMATRGTAAAYMITGGALFIAGLIIGGDAGTAVAIGGGALGAYGIFLTLRY